MIRLQQNEKIVMVRRKHWFVFLRETLPLMMLLVLPAVLWAVIGIVVPLSGIFVLQLSAHLPKQITVFLGAFWFLLIWMRFFVSWTNYYLDVWIATDQRVIDIEQVGLFRRDVSTFNYEQIQDITVETHGLIQTILDFGNIHVETAGATREILMEGVSKPNSLRDFISEQHAKAIAGSQQTNK